MFLMLGLKPTEHWTFSDTLPPFTNYSNTASDHLAPLILHIFFQALLMNHSTMLFYACCCLIVSKLLYLECPHSLLRCFVQVQSSCPLLLNFHLPLNRSRIWLSSQLRGSEASDLNLIQRVFHMHVVSLSQSKHFSATREC